MHDAVRVAEECSVPTTYGQSAFYLGQQGGEYYCRQSSGGIESGELEARKLRGYLGSPRSLLDFGCGGGFLLEVLGRTVPTVCGVEPNPHAWDFCSQRGIEVVPSVAALNGRKFDAVVSNHCLEHVPYPIAALREIKACIAEEGLLVMALPVDDWRRQRNIREPDKDHHLHTWTPVLIRNTLAEAGYATERVDVLTHAWPRYWKSLYRVLPPFVFDLTCRIWSAAARRRQLIVVARPCE